MSFFKNLWFGKPTPDPILQGYITDIAALTGVMEDMRTKFATYCNSVVHVGTTGLDLADGIHKFNSKLRPGHQPSLSFAQVQYAFREQLRLRWARQFKEEAIYMFEHWYKQSEAQRNTIANYEIARQHCHHLKSQLAEHHEARARLVEKNKSIPEPLERDIQEAQQQYQKYSKALESMRAAIVSNQQRLAGPQGQFVYFDRAFATLLEMQVALEREMRRVVAAYEPLIADARARAGAGGVAATATGGEDDAAAAGGSPLRRGSFVGEDDAFRAHLKEMAEFVVQTSLEKDDVTGATTSPQKRAQEVDAILSQFTPSAPPTPSAVAGGLPGGLGRLSLGGDDGSFAASPRHSTRKKKRLSWGVNSGVSVADSPPPAGAGVGAGAGAGTASLVAQAIAEEPYEDDDDDADVDAPPHVVAAAAVAAAAAASASPEKAASSTAATAGDGAGSAVRGRSRRSESVVDTEIDIDLFLEGHFPADDDEDVAASAFVHPAPTAAAPVPVPAAGSDAFATPVKSSLPPLPSLTPTLSLLADANVDTPAETLAKTAPWRHEPVLAAAGPSAPAAIAAAAAGKKAGTHDDDSKSASDSTSDSATAAATTAGEADDEEVEWPPELIVRDIELKAWESRGGRRKPLRELLATLHLVLWPGVAWRVVPIATMSGWSGVSAVLSRAWAVAAPVAEAAKKELTSAAAAGTSGGAAGALAALGETTVGSKYLTALRIVGALALAAETEAEGAIAAASQGGLSP